jgi:SecD/SecF fusion protein
LAIFHDVVVVLACFSILYGLLPFTLEIDQAFIAAILTVVGYSINDTVVVYDRIREYLREHHKHEPLGIIERAMNSTIGRTFNTSMTTFVVLLMIFIFGSETIRGFAFALMVGVIVGTYSSLFVATPSTVDLTSDWHKQSEDEKKKEVSAAS